MCKENSFFSSEMYFRGSREVKPDNALKFTKEGLPDEIPGPTAASIAVNETLILWWY
jgi:hypothetical protein